MEKNGFLKLETIEKALEDPDCNVREAAMKACVGRDVPPGIIQKGLKDPIWSVRKAAMEACVGRDVPPDIIRKGLEDSDQDVRNAALEACKGRDLLYSRSFEPKGLVYKKCLKDVIVVAEIPQDAHVRGSIGHACRASKAIIKEIIGDFYGEKVGISMYDKTTTYREGDIVEVEDFDFGHEDCSNGFHFFNSIQEAREC